MTKDSKALPDLKAVMAHLNAEAHALATMSSKDKKARTVARLVCVQALYQMEMTGIGVEAVIREFTDYRFDGKIDSEVDDSALAEADAVFFAEGLRTIVKEQAVIDRLVSDRLSSGWRLDRLDATLRAILRSGAFELKFRSDIATEIVINEYIEIAKAFYGDTEARFVNAALDGLASDTR
jgi:transcription antitermination protein NusB